MIAREQSVSVDVGTDVRDGIGGSAVEASGPNQPEPEWVAHLRRQRQQIREQLAVAVDRADAYLELSMIAESLENADEGPEALFDGVGTLEAARRQSLIRRALGDETYD
jgi:hypothetical protein